MIFFKKKVTFPNNFESQLKNLLDNLCCGAEITPENLYGLERIPKCWSMERRELQKCFITWSTERSTLQNAGDEHTPQKTGAEH